MPTLRKRNALLRDIGLQIRRVELTFSDADWARIEEYCGTVQCGDPADRAKVGIGALILSGLAQRDQLTREVTESSARRHVRNAETPTRPTSLCARCHGSGEDEDSDELEDCPWCDGTGEILDPADA